MHDYHREHEIPVSAETLFGYLSDVANLPHYFARMRTAQAVSGDEVHTTAVIDTPDGQQEVEGTAWFRRDPQAQAIEWGSEGQNNYRGRLTVSGPEDGPARVALEIHTEADHDGLEQAIDETLSALESAVTGS